MKMVAFIDAVSFTNGFLHNNPSLHRGSTITDVIFLTIAIVIPGVATNIIKGGLLIVRGVGFTSSNAH